jgi:homoserine kinase
MEFLTYPVTVRTPASSANLGPGFDSLGLALARYDTATAQVRGNGVRVEVSGEGAGELPTDEQHLIVQTMLSVFEGLGVRPSGIELRCHNTIPQARGMGSSSAAIVSGVLLARQLAKDGPALLDEAAVVRLAAEKEGHPDNVAACVLGGFTVAWIESTATGQQIRAMRMEDAKGVTPIIFIPEQRGYTAQARGVLPASVPLKDAVFNSTRTILLGRALTGTPELLFEATEDRLHQPYRAATMPETMKLVADLRGMGFAAVVSGAGPSVLALVPEDSDLAAKARSLCPSTWKSDPVQVAWDGAQVVDDSAPMSA